jgi:hypothetical protein
MFFGGNSVVEAFRSTLPQAFPICSHLKNGVEVCTASAFSSPLSVELCDVFSENQTLLCQNKQTLLSTDHFGLSALSPFNAWFLRALDLSIYLCSSMCISLYQTQHMGSRDTDSIACSAAPIQRRSRCS